MERNEAAALLKELITLKLVSPSFLSIRRNEYGKFDVVLKTDVNAPDFKQFITERNLIMYTDKEGFCVISRT